MCGIAGIINKSNCSSNELFSNLERMINAISYRGPDASNVCVSKSFNLGFAHARLSIQDLSHAGSQPMKSVSERYLITFNGEIYNHHKLRHELRANGYTAEWRGSSDTESLLAAFEVWGFENTLSRIIGMFAFALLDREDGIVYLARDRFGEKPLYYASVDNAFIFASELKSLKCYPKFDFAIDSNALGLYFKYGYIPSPYSIYKNINKLEPGEYLEIKTRSANLDVNKCVYWSLKEQYLNGQNIPFSGDFNCAVNQLEFLMSKSVSLQMVADVPMGCFLSGGVDSSLVAALMQKNSKLPIETFSIGFENPKYDESLWSNDIAKYIGANHSQLTVSSKDALNVVPLLPNICDEPFADVSIIPTYLLSKLAKSKISVALTGDGGDEVFGGYRRHIFSKNRWPHFKHIPKFLLYCGTQPLRLLQNASANTLMACCGINRISMFSEKLVRVLNTTTSVELYNSIVGKWDSNIYLHYDIHNPSDVVVPRLNSISDNPTIDMLYFDGVSYLPDDVLCKVDRASMAVSLETRAPFLDHRVISFSATLPMDYKIWNRGGKRVVKALLNKYFPNQMIDRPKKGFSVPIDDWLRCELRDWAEDLLDRNTIVSNGMLNNDLIQKKWKQHIERRYNWGNDLWTVLMYQSWLKNERNSKW